MTPASSIPLFESAALLEALPVGAAWSVGDRAISFNATAALLLAAPERSLDLEQWRRLRWYDAKGAPVEPDPLSSALEGRITLPQALMLTRSDGAARRVQISACPISGPDGTLAVALFDEAPDGEISWQWIGALGHELNNALHTVAFSTQDALGKLDRHLRPERRQLEQIRGGAERAARLVSNLVRAAQLGREVLELHQQTFDLSRWAEHLVERPPPLRPGQRLQATIQPNVFAHCDPDWLEQIVLNLIGNAIKYAATGPIELGISSTADNAMVWIRDAGPGIAAIDQAKLFRPFSRLPSAQRGSGLGLWLSRELARRMGGTLWLESQAGEHSTFWLSLPPQRFTLNV